MEHQNLDLDHSVVHDLILREKSPGNTVVRSDLLEFKAVFPEEDVVILRVLATCRKREQALESASQLTGLPVKMISRIFDDFVSRGIIHPNREIIDRPIIIISVPRAGSTLLFETLAQASPFWTVGGESHRVIESFPQLRPESRNYDSHRLSAEDSTPVLNSALRGAFALCALSSKGKSYRSLPIKSRPESIRLLEKTPRNSLRVSFLYKVFPDAKFIFLYREPKANIHSIMEAWRSDGFWQFKGDLPDWDREEWCMLLPPGWRSLRGKSLADIAAFQWRISNLIAMKDLKSVPTDRKLIVTYEDLIQKPVSTLRKIWEFSELSAEEGLGDLLSTPLGLSSSVVTPPSTDKWRKDEDEIIRVLSSVEDCLSEAKRILSDKAE